MAMTLTSNCFTQAKDCNMKALTDTKPEILLIEASQHKAYERCIKGLSLIQATKTSLYRDMKRYQRLCRERAEDMQGVFEPIGGVDIWFKNTFGPTCDLLCEDPYILAKAIYDGMSLVDYLGKSPAIFLAEKKVRRASKAKANQQINPSINPQDAGMTDAEAASYYKAEFDAARLRERRLATEVKRLTELVSAYEKQLAKLSGDNRAFIESLVA
jgi:hypothetical protein